jgi:hypothetical protein
MYARLWRARRSLLSFLEVQGDNGGREVGGGPECVPTLHGPKSRPAWTESARSEVPSIGPVTIWQLHMMRNLVVTPTEGPP